MKLTATALGICVTAALLTGCGGGGDDSTPGGREGAEYVDGATFTMALKADPGNLDPQASAQSAVFTMTQLGYDALVSVDPETGAVQSRLASDWSVDGTTVTLTLNEGVTCADGTEFTASIAADNLAYVGDPKNESPFLGTFLPAGATAKADDAARTVTLTLAAPAPFVLNGLASLPMVCPSGMDDRKSLAKGTSGTGPYELTEAAPGDHYTYTVRDGYAWGPNGAATDEEGTPEKIVMKIVENESTAANLLLSGGLNAAQIIGPDADRLEKSGLYAAETPALIGEQWYNQADGHATGDADVRTALTQALDLEELRSVLTSGKGSHATTLAAIEPVACPGDAVSDSLPAQDVEAAKAVLEAADLPKLTLIYDTGAGTVAAAAAELAVQQWKEAGVTVTVKGQDGTAINETLFGTGDWDIAWVPLNVNSPDQLVPFLSGPAVPDGTNFAAIDNADYAAAVKRAGGMSGEEGCDSWLEAESALVAAADIVPFANNVVKTYGAKAEFLTPGQLLPTSIRMLAK